MIRYKDVYRTDYYKDKYHSKYFEDILFEKSLSRIYRHFSDSGFIIGSAFRPIIEDPIERVKGCGVESNEENFERHKYLLKWLKSKRLGFIVVDGYWIDYKTKTRYPELSVFVPYRDIYTSEEFLNIALHWTSKGNPRQGHFCQDAVLVKDPDVEDYGKLFLLSKDGSTITKKGIFKPNQIAEIYTQFKKKSGRTFVFEGVQTYDMFWSKELLIKQGHIFS